MSISDLPPHTPPAIASAVIAAVNADPELPLFGSYVAEAVLMTVHARGESNFKLDAVGDHGRSLGAWQLQRVPAAIAFDPMQAARIWLSRAHASHRDCLASNGELAALAELVSGSCRRGTRLSTYRGRLAQRFLAPYTATAELE